MSAIFVIATLIVASQSLRSNPLFVTYVDFPTCTAGANQDATCLANMAVPGYASHSYNIVNYAFYLPERTEYGPNGWLADASGVWNDPGSYLSGSMKQTLTGSSSASASQIRAAIKQKFTDAGVKLLLSVFGGTSHPMGSYSEASITSNGGVCDKIANVVEAQLYDGVDIDFEQTAYFQSGTAETWLCTLTNCLRQKLGQSAIITHAPQAPYMGHSGYPNGAYLGVHRSCGNNIDWYNTQFYNQGSTSYGTYNTLINTAIGWSTNTAVKQIIQGNNFKGWSIPADKLVIGKFIRANIDGSTGWMSGQTLKGHLEDFMAEGTWNAGFMTWQYIGDKNSNFEWSNAVVSAFSSSPVPAPSPVIHPTPPPISPVLAPTPTPPPTPQPTQGGTGGIITVHIFSNSDWWLSFYLTNYGSNDITSIKVRGQGQSAYATASISWTSGSLGPVYGCSPGPQMKAPLQVKLIRNDGSEISGATLQARSAGASATFGSSFLAYHTGDNDDSLSWPAYFAIIMCVVILIGCIVAFICYKKKKENKEVTFNHGDKETANKNHAEIEIGDETNTNTQT